VLSGFVSSELMCELSKATAPVASTFQPMCVNKQVNELHHLSELKALPDLTKHHTALVAAAFHPSTTASEVLCSECCTVSKLRCNTVGVTVAPLCCNVSNTKGVTVAPLSLCLGVVQTLPCAAGCCCC
jgi:hypothetical protein